ncbi:transport protein Trs120 or TRAPPC9 TRAPP II complex subunit-domain-containing protein [Cladochytrium replicatum]|nr:transport protein Trs120 or TRAPPC9 TRAPP II complex subunit-domain-containing protein [Cladochytrium replicatum]
MDPLPGSPSSFDFINNAKIRILLVPIAPIKKDTFRRYVDVLSRFNVVSLADLTPADPNKGGKFTEQLFHEGYMYLNFVTSYDRERAQLEDFQLHRQIMGVIGIMHCQQVHSLSDGMKRFNHTLERYPSVLVSRCFAFEPSETQADDTKGLIMIPNVGQLSFYLTTMINDFASEMLTAFGGLAAQIEKRTIINGPNLFTQIGATFAPTAGQSTTALNLSTNALSTAAQDSPARPGLGSPALTPAVTSAQESLGGLGFNVNLTSFLPTADKGKKRSPARAQKLLGDLYLMSGRLDLALTCYSQAAEQMKSNADYIWQAAALEGYVTSMTLSLLAKAGVGPQAPMSMIETGDSIEEEDKDDSDLQAPLPGSVALVAPTIESMFMAGQTHPQLRNLICEIPDRYRDIVLLYERGGATTQSVSSNGATGVVGIGAIAGTSIGQAGVGSTSGSVRGGDQGPSSAGVQPSGTTVYPILQIAAALKLAKFLAYMCRNRFTGIVVGGAGYPLWAPESKGIAEYASNIVNVGTVPRPGGGGGGGGTGTLDRTAVTGPGGQTTGGGAGGDRIVLYNGAGASRADVSSWLMKAWSSGIEYLSISDQIWCVTNMASIYAIIGYHRKHAFFLRQTVLLVLATLKSSATLNPMKRISGVHPIPLVAAASGEVFTDMSSPSTFPSLALTSDPPRRTSLLQTISGTDAALQIIGIGSDMNHGTNGALECLKRVCDVLGMGSSEKQQQSLPSKPESIEPRSRRPSAMPTRSAPSPIPAQFAHESEDEDDWLDEYEDEDDIDAASTGLVETAADNDDGPVLVLRRKKRVRIPRARFGWPDLQVDVLKECVDVAYASDDVPNTIIYASRLLRRLHVYLSRSEQLELSDMLQSLILRTRSALGDGTAARGTIGDDTSSRTDLRQMKVPMPVMVKGLLGGVTGVPVLRRLEVVAQSVRRTPFRHRVSELGIPHKGQPAAGGANADPFIYNPFADRGGKKNKEVMLIAGEPAYFDVVLANPFAFDLDIQSIAVKTSGIPFVTHPTQADVPAESRLHVIRLSGVPQESGTLQVHGITVRMLGGCVQEDIVPIKHRKQVDAKKNEKDGKRRKQDDRERLVGRKAVSAQTTASSGPKRPSTTLANHGDDRSEWSLPLTVIPEMPMLQLSHASFGTKHALMLFEGELTTFYIVLENIGTQPINHLAISFSETYVSDGKSEAAGTMSSGPGGAQDTLEMPEDVYERDVHDRSVRVFSFLSETADEATVPNDGRFGAAAMLTEDSHVTAIPLELPPGGKKRLKIAAFGKKGCTGGSIKLAYGYVRSVEKEEDTATKEESSEASKDIIFYTRQLTIPVLMTVQRALEALNMDLLMLPTSGRSKEAAQDRNLSLEELTVDATQTSLITKHALGKAVSNGSSMEIIGRESEAVVEEIVDRASEYCLFTFDLRNVWSNLFEVTLDVYDEASPDKPTRTFTTVVHAGVTKRIILPVKRLSLMRDDVARPIPTPHWKQFVVGKVVKFSGQEEFMRRSMFWMKEELVGGLEHHGRVVARWVCDRSGSFLLRTLKLNRMMMNVLKQEEVSFSVQLLGDSSESAGVANVGTHLGQCRLGEFVTLRWTITNRTDNPIKLFLRVEPMQDLHNGQIRTDLTGLFAWTGMLQTVLPVIPAHAHITHDVSVVFLSQGRFRFPFHAEDCFHAAATAEVARAAEEATKLALAAAKRGERVVEDVGKSVAKAGSKFLSERFYWGEPFMVESVDRIGS